MSARSFAVVAAAAALAIAGCATQSPEPHTWDSSYDYGTPGSPVESHASVAYYPACRNEILNFDGHRWFPFLPANASDFPSDPLTGAPAPLAAADAGDSAALAGPVGAVVMPGPGDDVGTLVVFESDLAYWESESGRLSTWLTNHTIEYNWAC